MQDELIKLETAKLLENKGYGRSYNKHTKESYTTQTSATRWLREKKNLSVEVFSAACGYHFEICKVNRGTHVSGDLSKGPNEGGAWDSWEEAAEEGILEGLSLC